MKLHFDSNQIYQLEAIKSVTDLFEGQQLNGGDFEFSLVRTGAWHSADGVGNSLELTDEQIWENVKAIQQRNDIKTDNTELQGLNFSVEMETGTGKTYVYLRTIYELYRLYGFSKFVIVTPSIAIREGILKNLQITHEHFQTLYDRAQVNYSVYDSKKVSNLRGFASGTSIQILVLNIDAFAKDENIINKPNDRLTGKCPIEFIQTANPIVIVDEPQNMETDIRKRAIEKLNPLCTLRYSATHTNLYNLVYSLNPVKAYDAGLVKQIEVDLVISENAMNSAFIQLEKINATKYDNYIPLESSVETQFARDCESSENVEFYFKLPEWFKIKTPIGTYNPDWALVFKGEKKIYFVAETKSADQELRPSEKMKIDCGKAHFRQFDEVTFKGPISSVSELNS